MPLETVKISISDEVHLLDQPLNITPGLYYKSAKIDIKDISTNTRNDNTITETLSSMTFGFGLDMITTVKH